MMVREQRRAIRNVASVDRRGACGRLNNYVECHDDVLTERRDAPASANDACCVSSLEAFFGIGVEMMYAAHDVIANNYEISSKIETSQRVGARYATWFGDRGKKRRWTTKGTVSSGRHKECVLLDDARSPGGSNRTPRSKNRQDVGGQSLVVSLLSRGR